MDEEVGGLSGKEALPYALEGSDQGPRVGLVATAGNGDVLAKTEPTLPIIKHPITKLLNKQVWRVMTRGGKG